MSEDAECHVEGRGKERKKERQKDIERERERDGMDHRAATSQGREG